MQYGFNSYYGIPPNFIDFSIKENIIFFFQLSQLFLGISTANAWIWTILIIFILIIALIIKLFFNKFKKLFSIILLLILGSTLFGFYYFGDFIAKNNDLFYVLLPNCSAIGPEKYIAPIIYNDKAIFITVDDQNNLKSGFIVKEISDLSCAIEQRKVGKIKENN